MRYGYYNIIHRRANSRVHHQGSGSIDALDLKEGSGGRMARTTRKDRVGIDLGSTEAHDKGACRKASTTYLLYNVSLGAIRTQNWGKKG